ncbi:3-oxosteroid 1-dehydrogenase [Slackia heliotrinireducens]|uniref:Succinate dehydrogenase/fumarate reductase flavoprotein subunit n=1 Tax=Slackia heliotrinireducens (strain ATCC 29202 / DSM 20476 / NCTC 11029 / RHS 1) TaxID=471855 RepID=C7N673_SLAHD|nr:FAD-dependent oxidoreductase [Slackia heliotrinireducens]ACV22408.1 succinate dehydrogenase/fumarate reductase flavoprotein subunit [Slackia heliotrinireducens DSM 20476]VEH00731.1 3-oxosteroid 1-dehydrogenase [Slackia heliotrinireducens]
MSKHMSRRDMFKLGGIAGLSAMAAASLAGCGGQPRVAGEGGGQAVASDVSDITWDEEADVVVIGSGTGSYTAMRCANDGLDVIVLEKNAQAGGSTIFSSSVVWAPCNDLSVAEGIEDSREEALTYIEALSGDTFMPDEAAAYIDNVNAAVRNSTEIAGVEWAIWPAGIDYSVFLPGGKERGRAILPKVPEGETSIGKFNGPIIEAAQNLGARYMTSTPAKSFISRTNEDGTIEVLGVAAESNGKRINVRARKAVVLASGGFDWNMSMMENYLRTPARYSWGIATDEGDGQKMAMRLGADLRFMAEAFLSPGYKKEFEDAHEQGMSQLSTLIRDDAKRGIIFVNKHGKRFTNECASYDCVGRSFGGFENNGENRGWANLPAWAIIDQEAADNHTFNSGELGTPGNSYTKYDTLEELADACGIDKEGLLEEIARFNENAEQGLDPDFGRGQDYYGQNSIYTSTDYEGAFRTLQPIATPPFYAAEIVPVVLGTMGGAKTNANAEVVDTDGNVISRLYAQGNVSGIGAGGACYVGGGGTIGPGIAYGEIAANQIQNLTDWQ